MSMSKAIIGIPDMSYLPSKGNGEIWTLEKQIDSIILKVVRFRTEVLETCKGTFPDADALRNMKALTMVIKETLRLYRPATFVIRQALEDIDFKGVMIPKDTNIQIPIPTLQQSLELCCHDDTSLSQKDLLMRLLRLARFHRHTCRLVLGLEYAQDNTLQWQNSR
ncbi:hypothetical protein CRYUN_Cryun20dG0008400 [Craigia yunnanensis]